MLKKKIALHVASHFADQHVFSAFGFLRKSMANDDQTQENHNLYLFLAHQNSITTNLKTEVQQIAGYVQH